MASKKKSGTTKKRTQAKTRGKAKIITEYATEPKRAKLAALFTNEPDPLIIEPVQPLIQTPVQKESGLLDALGAGLDNEFDQADLLVLRDDRLRGNLDLFSQMVGRAYRGVDITQKGDQVTPRVLDDNEKSMLTTAQELERRLDFKTLFKSYTKSLIKYGDLIEHIETDTEFLDAEFDEVEEEIEVLPRKPVVPPKKETKVQLKSKKLAQDKKNTKRREARRWRLRAEAVGMEKPKRGRQTPAQRKMWQDKVINREKALNIKPLL